MLKKIILLLTTVFVIATLAGCQKNDSKSEEKPAETTGKKIEKSSNDVSIQVQG